MQNLTDGKWFTGLLAIVLTALLAGCITEEVRQFIEEKQTELDGRMEWIMEYPDEYEEFGGNRRKWTTYQVKKEDVNLIFKPKEGTVSGVSILLELGGVDFVEANETWTRQEGLYRWSFATLEGERAIRVTIMAPSCLRG